MKELDPWKKGDPLTASHLGQAAEALNTIIKQSGGVLPMKDRVIGYQGIYEHVTGEIVEFGPDASGDGHDARTDASYWIKLKYTNNDYSATMASGGTDFGTATLADEDATDGPWLIVLATNQAEFKDQTHLLSLGSIVEIWSVTSRSNVACTQKWWFNSGGGGGTVSGLITGNIAGGAGTGYYGKSRADAIPTYAAATGAVDETTLGTLAGSNDSIILNASEYGVSVDHPLTATVNTDQFGIDFIGRLIGTVADGDGKVWKVIEIDKQWAACTGEAAPASGGGGTY